MADAATLRALIAAPTLTRRVYNARGADRIEPRAIQVLIAVELLNTPTVKDIAAELALPHKTASTLLGKLGARGLVEATPDPADQRRQLQRITDAGRRLVAGFAADAADALE